MPNAAETKVLNEIAEKLGVLPEYLSALISFESSWNPKAKNPNSSARGLLQWVDDTARGLGYLSSLDLVNQNPDTISQLKGPVYRYLKKYAPFPTEQSLFMAVFYPKAIHWPATQAFPDTVRRKNPGINTPADYMAKVMKRIKKDKGETGGILLTSLAVLFFVGKRFLKG